MADITPQRVQGEHTPRVYKWEGVTSADTCLPLVYPGLQDKTFQVEGVSGHTVTLTGTVAPISEALTEFGLTDGTGTAISLTADGGSFVLENVYTYVPVVTGGSGGVDIYLIGA
mgnify:CR=1 FL=1